MSGKTIIVADDDRSVCTVLQHALVQAGYDPWGFLSAWGAQAVNWLCVAIILGFLVARFFLVLPARAVGRPMTFGESAVATRGNGVRLVAAYILVYHEKNYPVLHYHTRMGKFEPFRKSIYRYNYAVVYTVLGLVAVGLPPLIFEGTKTVYGNVLIGIVAAGYFVFNFHMYGHEFPFMPQRLSQPLSGLEIPQLGRAVKTAGEQTVFVVVHRQRGNMCPMPKRTPNEAAVRQVVDGGGICAGIGQ